jgi:iron complex outermembrane receptor protein
MEITKDTRGLEGKTPVWVPDVTASLWLQYDLFDGPAAGTTLGAGVRYVGEMQIDALNTGEVPDYTVFDLAASTVRRKPARRGVSWVMRPMEVTIPENMVAEWDKAGRGEILSRGLPCSRL